MRIRLAFVFLLSLLQVQLSTFPPLHGFSGVQWGVIGLESLLFCLCLFSLRQTGLTYTILGSIVFWVCQPFLVAISWPVSTLIHWCAGVISDSFLIGSGFSGQGFRFLGELVVADPSKTGSYFICLFLLHFFTLSLAQNNCSQTVSSFGQLVPKVLGWALLRWLTGAALLVLVNPDLVNYGWQIFWGLGLAVSMLPLVFFKDQSVPDAEETFSPGLVKLWVLGGAGLTLFLFGAPTFFPGPPPQVLIDESHSSWEPVAIRKNQRYDPVLAENNLTGWIRFLSQTASVTISVPAEDHETPPEASHLVISALDKRNISLDRFGLVILKCPTLPYSPDEIKNLTEFAQAGGTLWLLGDHTDVFFMNTHLNQLLAAMGVNLRSDSICDHRGRWLVTNGPLHSSLEMAPSQGTYMWASGASIDGGFRVIPLAVSSADAFSDRWNPQNPNFFGSLSPGLGHEYGPFILYGFIPYGKGRILIHGDSTNFNAALLGTPGKMALSHNVLRSLAVPNLWLVCRILFEWCFLLLSARLLGNSVQTKRYFFATLVLFFLTLPILWKAYPEIHDQKALQAMSGPKASLSLAVDYSLQPGIPLAYGPQQEITAGSSLDRLLQQLPQEQVLSYSGLADLQQTIQARPTGILLAAPQHLPAPEALAALVSYMENGGRVFIFTRGTPTGALRALLLQLGAHENSPGPPNTHSRLAFTGARIRIDQPFPDLIQVPRGAGALYLFDHTNQAHAGPPDFPRMARQIAEALKPGRP
jgi:hypothetical protein